MSFRNSLSLKISALIVAAFGVVGIIGFENKASAVYSGDFKAGNIIDDQVFFDPNSLSVSEIQTFLNSKVPVCDTWGTQPSGGTTRAAYGTSRGYAPPYTCIKDYIGETPVKYAESGLCNGAPQATKTAAEIIYIVSHSCGINPRVLIVLLQKEQGLITDDWPWSIQYRSATGMGCPDTSACDSEYYGFFNQVYHAARQFKRYVKYPDQYNHVAYRNGNIQWHPDFDSGRRDGSGRIIWEDRCGGSSVYIQNRATAGLYNYTPFQPNNKALFPPSGNQYAEGDDCSSYGNRNFWLYYHDWFGSTTAPSYWWEPASQGVYKDETKQEVSNTLVVGERRFVEIRTKNIGASTWYKNQVFLGTSQPQDRTSGVYDSSWISGNRVATMVEDQVPANSYATFRFWVKPNGAGEYKEHFNILREGVTWMNDNGLYVTLNSQQARYSWQPQTQTVYSDSARSQVVNTSQLKTGDRVYARVSVVNNGNVTWNKYNINLATSQPKDRYSALHGGQWLSTNRVATFNESTVNPGETATFDFSMTMPSVGYKKEYFNLVAEGITWMPDLGMYYDFTVQPDTYTWQPYSQRVFTDSSKSTETSTSATTSGKRYYLQVAVRNSGNTPWYKYGVNLATSLPKDRISAFRDASWLSANRSATMNEDRVNPGDIATFEFWVTAPSFSGERREYFNIVAEGITWMPDLGMYYGFTN